MDLERMNSKLTGYLASN